MRDTVSGRPFEVKSKGDGRYVISFFPMTDNPRNPDLVVFRLTTTKADLAKISRRMG